MFIESYILRLLAAVADSETLTEAGEKTGATQPSISRAMQKLERELEVSLFDRAKNRMALNETGRFAAEYAKKIMALQDEMILKTREKAGIMQSLSIGSVAIMPALASSDAAKKIYNGIQASFKVDESEKRLLKGLDDGTFQIVMLLRPVRDKALFCQKYFSENLYVLLPKSHALAKRKSLHLKDLAGETFIMNDDIGFWDLVKREKIPGAKFIRVERKDKDNPIAQIVAESDILAFISNRTTQYGVPKNRVAVPLLDSEMNVTFYAVCKRETLSAWKRLFEKFAEGL